MSSPLAVLRRPQVAPILASSLLGRLPGSAVGLLLALVARHTGLSFAATGLVTAVLAVAVGISAPPLGRLIDLRGQRQVLLACGILSAVVWLAVAALPQGSPAVVLALLALLGGLAIPPLGSSTRALWDDVLPGPDDRHAILSLELALQDAVFALGPLVLVTVLASISLRLSMVAVAVMVFAGCAAFTAQPASRRRGPRAHPHRRGVAGALADPAVRALAFVAMALGASFGALELACVAYGDEVGSQGTTGVLVAVTGLGSVTGGLWAARHRAPVRPAHRLGLLVAVMAVVGALPVILVAAAGVPDGLVGTTALAVLLFAGGLTIAPAAAVLYGLMGSVAPPAMRTEAYTWLAAGTTGGAAAGSALGGIGAGAGGAAAAFAVVPVAAALGLAAVWAVRRQGLA